MLDTPCPPRRLVVAAAGLLWAAILAPDPVAGQKDTLALPAGFGHLVTLAERPQRLASPLDDVRRIAEITGLAAPESRLVLRRSRPDSAVGGLMGELLPAESRVLLNSGYAHTGNDGLLWAGRGLSSAVSGGVRFRWRALSIAVAPEVAWQQNRAWEIRPLPRPGISAYAYPYDGGIDYPQRFGPDSFWSAGPGASHVRVDAFGAAAGLSSENLWWGPATRYPILMSSTAAGFPHAFLGTSGPLSIGIGTLEAELILGGLTESEHFDQNPLNDRTMLLGVVGAFSPRGLDGLSLGAARVYQYKPEGDGWDVDGGVILDMFLPSGSNRPGNELISLFGRWVLAPGAEVYGEWAREDRFFDLAELLQEPDHSHALMLGMQKVAELRERLSLRVQLEAVALQHLGELRESSRPLPIFYTHHEIRQGYTHRGQLLGAWIGPGGDAQYLAVDALTDRGMGGVFLERVRRADASTAAIAARRWWPYQHDTALTFGVRGISAILEDLTVAGSASWSYRYNRDFLERDDTNIGLSLEATWSPPAVRP